jgi:hypothetical protein
MSVTHLSGHRKGKEVHPAIQSGLALSMSVVCCTRSWSLGGPAPSRSFGSFKGSRRHTEGCHEDSGSV